MPAKPDECVIDWKLPDQSMKIGQGRSASHVMVTHLRESEQSVVNLPKLTGREMSTH